MMTELLKLEDSKVSKFNSEIKISTTVRANFIEVAVKKANKRVFNDNPFLEYEQLGFKSLWRSVLIQAIYDVSGTGGNIERKILRAETLAWLGSQDFYEVCELAGLDPKLMMRVTNQIRKAGIEINETMKFKQIRRAIKKTNKQGEEYDIYF